MQKILFMFAVMFITIMTLNSCSKDEPTPSFQVQEVCHDWGASREHALQEMQKFGWTYTGHEGDLGMTFEFKNNKDITSIVCVDIKKGLLSVSVYYLGMNGFFDELKSVLSERFKLVNWKTYPQYINGTSIGNTASVTMYTFYSKDRKAEGMAYDLISPEFLDKNNIK